MANHILRLDLSTAARDFQQVALEPGLPMLDRTGANYGILRRWLGRYVAEPVWDANQSVQFYVRDEERGRLSQAVCQPATKADLEGNLKADLVAMRDRLKKIKPASTTEQALHRLASQALGTGASLPENYDSLLFKYREASGAWKLVWCWGYQRKDHTPATSAVCHSAECRQLYECRAGEKNRCPSCSAAPARSSRGGLLSHRIPTVAALLLVVLAVLGIVAWQTPPKLVITPAAWSGPQGSRVEYKVIDQRWYVINRDVTALVVPQSHDRRIVEIDSTGAVAKAKAPGQTQVTFRYQDRKAYASFNVGPPRTPASIAMQPSAVQLAEGATTQLQLLGKYDDGTSMNLTDAAEWQADANPIATVRKGLVHASGSGKSKIKARYRAKPGDPWQYAFADVEVAPARFKSLTMRLTPEKLNVGQSGTLEVTALDEAGKQHSLTGSPKLKLEISPAEVASTVDGHVLVKSAGKGKLKASFGDLTQTADFEVAGEDRLTAGVFSVEPELIDLAVKEQVKLDVVTSSDAPIETISSDPKIVEVVGADQLVGRGAGTASITLTQGTQKQTVTVKVTDASLSALRIDPQFVSVRVGEIAPVQVFAATHDGKEIEISPALLKWVQEPSPDKASFDIVTLRVAGLAPTKEREKLTAQLGTDLTASADVEVSPGTLLTDLAAMPPETAIVGNDPIAREGTSAGKTVVHEESGGTVIGGKKIGTTGSGVLGNEVVGHGGVGNGAVTTGNGAVTTGTGNGIITAGNGIVTAGNGVVTTGNRVITSGSRVVTTGNGVVVSGPVGTDVVVGGTGVTAVGPGVVVAAPGEVVGERPAVVSLAVQEVKLLGLRVQNLALGSFQSALEIAVSDKGSYRVVDAKGEPLCDWVNLGANATATLNCLAVPRTITDEYELFIERKIGDISKRYQFPFKIRADK
jgi:hypothetical protein